MIDFTKKVVTGDGKEVRIYCTDGGGMRPIHGAVRCGDVWEIRTWYASGRRHSTASYDDLSNPVERIQKTVWLNVYRDPPNGYVGYAYQSREGADYGAATSTRLACIPITIDCEVGEGLEDGAPHG